MTELVFATNNLHKIKEIESCINNEFRLKGLLDVGVVEDIPEDEATLEGNALSKARYVHKRCNCNVFADDTGLEVESLGNLPGVHSARYAGESRDPKANMAKLLKDLQGIDSRKARFRTVIALIYRDEEFLFEGIVNGTILTRPRGTGGFGYDPLFVPYGYDISFAEMSMDEKNRISHRAVAIRKLADFLNREEHNNNGSA